MNKDVKQLVARVRRQGFTVRFGGTGHYRISSPGGDTVTISASPRGGRRSHANARADLKRIGAQL